MVPGLTDPFFFIFEFGVQFSPVSGELFAEGGEFFLVPGGVHHFRFKRNFPRGNFGGILGIQLGKFLFLPVGEF